MNFKVGVNIVSHSFEWQSSGGVEDSLSLASEHRLQMPTLYFNRIYIMTRPELIDYLFQLILQRLEPEFAPEEKVEHTESTTLEELGFDSLAKIDIVLVVETHFKVKVSREQLGTIKTVGDIADVLLTIKPSICDRIKE